MIRGIIYALAFLWDITGGFVYFVWVHRNERFWI